MSTSMKDGLNYILQAINNLIEPKLDKLRYDKTYRAKVTAIAGGGLYEVQIKNTKYNVSYSGALSIGDVVKVKAPLNNFSDIYIEGAQSGGGGDYTVSDTLPIGAVVEWYANNIPNNWLVCNGQAVSRENYSELFGIIGTQYGSGDGSTTFNLPNLKGRVPVGLDPDDTDFNSLGKIGGQKSEDLRATVGATYNTTTRIGYVAAAKIPNINYSYSVLGSDVSSNIPASAVNHSTLVLTQDGKNPSSLQPYLVSYFIIKAKQITPIIATVINNLNSDSTIDALAANQGRILNNKIVANSDLISTLQEDVIGVEDNMITSVKLNNTALPKTNKEVNIPIASKTQLGVFKVGENLTISEEGILSATGGGGSSGNEVEVSEQAPTEGTVEIWVDLKEEYGFSPTIQSELYYSEEGLGTNIKLRDNPLDYDYLLIQYYTATDQPIINGCKLIPIDVHVDNSYNLNENYEDTDFSYIYNARITLTGIGIEFSSNKTIKISNGRQVIENTPIIIYKVIGFKK